MFSKVFSDLLQSRDITAYQMSKDTGISQGMISHWKSGKRLPAANHLLTIASYLGVSVEYLLTGDDSAPSPAPAPVVPVVPAISETGKVMLSLFEQLPREDQLILIGRLMERVERMKRQEIVASLAGEGQQIC